MASTWVVTLPLQKTAQMVYDAVINGSFTGEMIDHYEVKSDEGVRCIVLVFEKHYYRAGNRLTLTVTLDDLQNGTRVHAIGGGGGEGLFRFDWGASESFENVLSNALRPYCN